MSEAFLHASPVEILARLEAVSREAAVGGFVLRVGAAHNGFCNVGLDLPRARRTAQGSRMLRLRLHEALERAGVEMAENALAPKVGGDLRGTVQVREVACAASEAALV
ncbi:MAG: hypothetical protein ABJE95_06340 [Byssovorax sp.]